MQALQTHALLSSNTHAMDQLQDFLRQRRAAHAPVPDLGAFEQELHRLFVAAEREALSHDLARFDLDVPVVEVDGERCHRVLRCATTYTSAVGPVRGSRAACTGTRRAVRPSVLGNGALGSSRALGPRWRRSRLPGSWRI